MKGYKHTETAKKKMKERLIKYGHPFLGKCHNNITRKKISLKTKGINNPMFGKKHSNESKKLMSKIKSKQVYLYKLMDEKLELVEIYSNSIEVANILNLHKSTIGRYIKNKKFFLWKSNNYILSRILISSLLKNEK
jgi:group I intron endonuclease